MTRIDEPAPDALREAAERLLAELVGQRIGLNAVAASFDLRAALDGSALAQPAPRMPRNPPHLDGSRECQPAPEPAERVDGKAYAKLHDRQHFGPNLVTPQSGGLIVEWAADEIAALRAAVAKLEAQLTEPVDAGDEEPTPPAFDERRWQAALAALPAILATDKLNNAESVGRAVAVADALIAAMQEPQR